MDIQEIKDNKHMEAAFEIRRLVFVIEQQVPANEEYDEYEESSTHLIATEMGFPVGTCRFRNTEKGIKLERFAVLKNFRKNGVGGELVLKCLEHPLLSKPGLYIYMHAQEHAIGFYEKFGFTQSGDRFYECNIPHFEMSKMV